MNLLMTGGTGLIGTALQARLLTAGYRVTILTRNTTLQDTDSLRFINHLDQITTDEQFEVFINLAGESMAQGRWSDKRKRQLLESRVHTTGALAELAQRLTTKPAVVLSASAIGIYGHQQDQLLVEQAPCQDGFSHRLCRDWEAAAQALEALGTRVCILRFGVVLAQEGGALAELMRSFQFGVAAWLGRGEQWLSWVHLDDVLSSIEFLLANKQCEGAYNITAPEPVRNRAFTEAIRRHKFALVALPVPGFVMRIALGEMAEELLLNGQRVIPQRLQEGGFEFQYPNLDQALTNLLK
jgi:uncharacterized protein (TIGR01777 family)